MSTEKDEKIIIGLASASIYSSTAASRKNDLFLSGPIIGPETQTMVSFAGHA